MKHPSFAAILAHVTAFLKGIGIPGSTLLILVV